MTTVITRTKTTTVITRTKTTTTIQLSEQDVYNMILRYCSERFSAGEYVVDFDVSLGGMFQGAVVTHTTPTMETITEI